jgi:hypothetical protein
MGHWSSLPCSQEPSAGPYPEPASNAVECLTSRRGWSRRSLLWRKPALRWGSVASPPGTRSRGSDVPVGEWRREFGKPRCQRTKGRWHNISVHRGWAWISDHWLCMKGRICVKRVLTLAKDEVLKELELRGACIIHAVEFWVLQGRLELQLPRLYSVHNIFIYRKLT